MRAAVAIALLVCACVPSQGPTMDPGRDCMECHGRGDALVWTASGTVFSGVSDPADSGVQGVRVTLTDAIGREIALQSNGAGNFYTREPLSFPLRARLEKNGVVREMGEPVTGGGCNSCHTVPAANGSSGRIALFGGKSGSPLMSPGEDCISCHMQQGGPAFQAAGTVYAQRDAAASQGVAGVTVRLTGADQKVTTLTSNAVGNFYIPDALAFPIQAEVQQGTNVQKMRDPIQQPGSCNRCHVVGGEAGGRVSLSGGGTGSPLMSPGEDCISCHKLKGGPTYTAAGTVYAQPNAAANQGEPGVTVQIIGSDSKVTTLTSNGAGNFYTSQPLAFPVRVAISKGGVSRSMETAVQSPASCNQCHSPGSRQDPGSYVSLTGD